MKPLRMAIAGVVAASVALGADTSTGGTVTLKTYLSATNSLRLVSISPGDPIPESPPWYLQLLDSNGNPVSGVRAGGGGSLEPVTASLKGTTGFVTSGGDWALAGFSQGRAYDFALGFFYDPEGRGYEASPLKGISPTYRVTLGGTDLSPPALPGQFAFGGAQVMTVMWPEPSVMTLLALGAGTFLMRRRT